MILNGVTAVTLSYFTEFDKPAFQHITASARRKESSSSLSHLLMSFLQNYAQCNWSAQAVGSCIRNVIIIIMEFLVRHYTENRYITVS